MCTVSLVVHAGGVRLVCNRDEAHSRTAAIPPIERRMRGRSVWYPVDPASGGSWIGVNSAGLAACLLNRSPRRLAAPGPSPPPSRGAIVPHVLEAASLDEALRQLRTLDARAFPPFRLVLVWQYEIAVVAGGAGHPGVAGRGHLARPRMYSSSSLGDERVRRPRTRLFDALINQRLTEMTTAEVDHQLTAQAMFHRHQWPARPEISVLMARSDARTVSRTQIDLTRAGDVTIAYEPLEAAGTC